MLRLKTRRASYLAVRGNIPEGPVLNDLIVLAGVAQLGVALHILGSKANAGALASGRVRRVHIVVALEHYQLPLCLGNVSGEGL